MATLPIEQVIHKVKIHTVQISDGTEDTTIGETLWLSTYTPPQGVVNTKSVTSSPDQQDRDVLEARVMANFGQDIEIEGGVDITGGIIEKISNTTLSSGNSTTVTKDISPFVTGDFTPFAYEIDPTSDTNLSTAVVMAGSVLHYTAGASDGTDTVKVIVTDQAGESVTVDVVVTVA